MELLTLSLVAVLLVANSFQEQLETLKEGFENFLVYPVETTQNTRKREAPAMKTSESSDAQDFIAFVEEQLVKQGQALQHLMKAVDTNERLTKALIENLGAKIEKPKLPEKIEVHHQSRRSNGDNAYDLPVVRMGKTISKYGTLFKDMILGQVQDNSEPIPVIEQELEDRNVNHA